jgi:hypothetical protein
MRTDDHWLELHIGLSSHPKTARLRRRLGVTLPQAIGHVVMTWTWAVRYAPNGDLSRFDADVVADAAGWDDDPGQFVRAMIAAGFLDEDLTIHDWDAYAGRLLDRREANARRMREAREKARAAGNGTEPDETRAAHATGTRAAHVRGLPDLTGQNRTGPDLTPPPNPLRTAEGEPPLRGGPFQGGNIGAADIIGCADVMTAVTEDDVALWTRARDTLTLGWLPANVEKARAFEPLGRGSDGGLRLRAPPWATTAVSPHQVRAALSQAGDAAGSKASIVT